MKNNNSVHEKLICRGIVSILRSLTFLFHSCALHPGSYLIAVLSKRLQTELLWPVKLLSTIQRSESFFFLLAENCYRHMSLLYEYIKRYVVVKS